MITGTIGLRRLIPGHYRLEARITDEKGIESISTQIAVDWATLNRLNLQIVRLLNEDSADDIDRAAEAAHGVPS